MAEGYRYGALAGHRVQTQVALACQIVCVCMCLCVYARAALAPLDTHIAISWPFAHSHVWRRGSMGRNQQPGKVRVCMCVSACKYACVCFLRVYLCAQGEAVEVGVTEVEVNRQLEKDKGNTGESFCCYCCDQTCPCDTQKHAHKKQPRSHCGQNLECSLSTVFKYVHLELTRQQNGYYY